ncbi:MAG: homoaconitate hydratase [Candidatus Aenigmarchaeota archaeon]|nr:homoaconitate hydratase [Candidatus Aenigmarchaeota archaeon]
MWGIKHKFSKTVKIFDTTLRDGEQMPGVVFRPEEKVELAVKSSEFGCHFINLMPSISDSEATLTKQLAGMGLDSEITADCMLKKEHIEKALECGVQRIMLFTSISDLHLERKLKITREENLSRSLEMIDFTREHGVKLDFGVEDATRADINYLIDFINKLHVEYFLPADTLGCMTPFQTYDFFKRLKKECKCKLCVHGHNDFGMATANVLAALSAGVDGFSGTFNGIGERAGNAPIEEVCVALKYLYGLDLKVNYKSIKEMCGLVEKYSGVRLQKHKPITGENAFTHESGIHVNGMLKDTRTYENFNPEIVGRKRKFLFGKHTGGSGLRYVLNDYKPSNEEVRDLLKKVKTFSESNKKSLSESDVWDLFKTNFRGDFFEN